MDVLLFALEISFPKENTGLDPACLDIFTPKLRGGLPVLRSLLQFVKILGCNQQLEQPYFSWMEHMFLIDKSNESDAISQFVFSYPPEV